MPAQNIYHGVTLNHTGEQGKQLSAGSLVLSGGLTAPVPLSRGRALSADFDGLGTVDVYG